MSFEHGFYTAFSVNSGLDQGHSQDFHTRGAQLDGVVIYR